jgi:hypothetical protein
MTTYYRLELLYDGEVWLANKEEFPTPEAAAEFRDKVIADTDHWGYYPIVEEGYPTRIVEVTERVVRQFPGLPVEDEV